jgi:hypothetical protein
VVWDGETNRRNVLLFGELEFTVTHWKLIEALDSEINNCYKKHNIMVSKTSGNTVLILLRLGHQSER